MKTILAFMNLIISLFNCTIQIYIVILNIYDALNYNIKQFTIADEVENKPERSLELSDSLSTVKLQLVNIKHFAKLI